MMPRFAALRVIALLPACGWTPALALLDKGARPLGVLAGPRKRLIEMKAFMTRHQLRPVIDRVHRLEELDQALEQMRSGQFIGKLVVQLY